MICEYCNNKFANKCNLLKHQNKTKYCIKIQKNKKEINKDNIILKLKNQIKEKDLLISRLDTELSIYKKITDKSQNCIEEIAKQPKNMMMTTIKNNMLMNMTPLDLKNNNFTDVIKNQFTKDYMLDGQKGVAKFAYDKLLKDKEGNLKYMCTDPARQIYKFKTNEGEIEKDVRAKKLTNIIIDNLVKQSRDIITENISNTDDGEIFFIYTNNFQYINEMKTDNGEFRHELASLVSN